MPKRPWNRVNLPVYSIASTDGKGNYNMHIITYAGQMSMEPKRFVCGIYEGTKTLENVILSLYYNSYQRTNIDSLNYWVKNPGTNLIK